MEKKEFKIGEGLVLVDVERTVEFYKDQNEVLLDCSCSDCRFYCDFIAKKDFEFFQLLKEMGVTLTKNLSTEPTGVWCVLDNGDFLYCENAFRVFGTIHNSDTGKLIYLKTESGFKMDAMFYAPESDVVDIYLDIHKVD
nr:hypothetical protein [uncultured Flavobacterium sp.]